MPAFNFNYSTSNNIQQLVQITAPPPVGTGTTVITNLLDSQTYSRDCSWITAFTATGVLNVTPSNLGYTSFFNSGVYRAQVSFASLPPSTYTGTQYLLDTTVIDAQFAVFEANYNPNIPAQAASYQAMVTAFSTIDALAAESIESNYAAINTQIELIQDELALFVTLDMDLTFNKETKNFELQINTALPNTLYSSQELVFVGNGTKYEATNFPLTYVDTNLVITPAMFGASFTDGVYQLNLSWSTSNSMDFNGVVYGLVTDKIDCGIAKYGAKIVKACNEKALETATQLLTMRKMVDLAFAAADYATTETLIKQIEQILIKVKCTC